jgi:hypothetical protein
LSFLFWPALLIWAWLLVKPAPFPEINRTLSSWGEFLPLLAAKALHVTVYAGLTAVGLVATRGRRWVMGVMAAHAVVTELGQYYGNLWFDTGRGGCVRDVLIDWAGVGIGRVMGKWVKKKTDPPEVRGQVG